MDKDRNGINQLANVLSNRMRAQNESPDVLDFGEIQGNGSLLTNTFPVPIPKGDYTICRQLALGARGELLTTTDEDGTHEHIDGGHDGHETGDGTHTHDGGSHSHNVKIPERMRSLMPGDRVLVAWVQNEAVVIDLVMRS